MENKLSSKIKRLLFSHGAFLIGRSVFEIFMNVFIWRLTKNIQTLAVFNIIYLLSHTLMFVVFAGWLRRGRLHLIRKLGLLGFGLVYLILFILNKNAVGWLYLLAALIGVVNGMYWFSYFLNRFDLTKIRNRANYTGLERSIKILVGFITPIAGGYVISSADFLTGYGTLFLIGVLFFLTSFFLGSIDPESDWVTPKISYWRAIKRLLADKKIFRSLMVDLCNGFGLNGALIRLILPLLIFLKTGTEFELGGWLSLFTLLSVASLVFIGKKVNYRQFDKIALIGGVMFIVAFLLLYQWPGLATLIIFGAIQQLSGSLIYIPRRVYGDNLLHRLENYRDNRIGYLVIREIFNIGIGMTSSYILVFFAKDLSIEDLTVYLVMMLVSVMAQVVLLASIRYSKIDLSASLDE